MGAVILEGGSSARALLWERWARNCLTMIVGMQGLATRRADLEIGAEATGGACILATGSFQRRRNNELLASFH
jgi:hypothetical protein